MRASTLATTGWVDHNLIEAWVEARIFPMHGLGLEMGDLVLKTTPLPVCYEVERGQRPRTLGY